MCARTRVSIVDSWELTVDSWADAMRGMQFFGGRLRCAFGVGKGFCLWLVMGQIKFFSRGVHPSAYERICVPESRRTFAAEKKRKKKIVRNEELGMRSEEL